MDQLAATKPATEPRIWSSVLRGLQLPMTEQNLDFPTLLDDCGITEDDLQAVHGKIPLKSYLRVMEHAAATADDPLLGRIFRGSRPEPELAVEKPPAEKAA